MRLLVANVLAGSALGFALSRIGFSSWDEIHRMFTLADPRLVLVFALGVAVLAAAWRIVRATSPGIVWPPKRIHRGTLAGGLIFGAGWALSGACPGITLVQVGEGQLLAILGVGGILVGNWLYAFVHARWFRWDTGGCRGD